MEDLTQLLESAAAGDSAAAERLLPLVYGELRQLAAGQMAREQPGHTLDATGLVHEAYLRLVQRPDAAAAAPEWTCRRYFFAAAAEAMRRILVESARRKGRAKRGGDRRRALLEDIPGLANDPGELLIVDEMLDRLAQRSARRAELVKLHVFGRFTIAECARLLGISPSTAEDDWVFARAWLRREWERGEKT